LEPRFKAFDVKINPACLYLASILGSTFDNSPPDYTIADSEDGGEIKKPTNSYQQGHLREGSALQKSISRRKAVNSQRKDKSAAISVVRAFVREHFKKNYD